MSSAELWEARREALLARLAELESVAVAFSGGVDSSVLLHAAHAALGGRALGVIADSPSLPRSELADAKRIAASIGAELVVVSPAELSDPRYSANSGDRCFWCKDALFVAMQRVADLRDLRAMAFGEITDDLLDDRPGARAAKQRGVVAPLREAGLSKRDVRRYAREVALEVASKPASACLASRIPVGTRVTAARLETVERAEAALRAMDVAGVLRVRHRGPRARVEVERAQFGPVEARWDEVLRRLAPLGFESVELAEYS